MAEKKEKTIVRAGSGEEVKPAKKTTAAKTVKKAEPKAEKVVEKVEETVQEEKKPVINQAKPAGSATPYRIFAIILWLAGLGMEILAIFTIMGRIPLQGLPTIAWFIIFLVIDLIVVIIGSQLWKKANHIKPASKKNPFLFWLWNNMGVIASVICFAPVIIILLTQKNLDKKTKLIGIIAALVALLIAGAASYDYAPISAEEQAAAENALTAAEIGDVYWSPYGRVYHTSSECQSLNHSDSLTVGSVDDAIAAGRTRICSFCARRDSIDTTGMITDGREAEAETLEEIVLPDAA